VEHHERSWKEGPAFGKQERFSSQRILNYIVEHRNQEGVTPGWINGVGLRGAYDF